MKKNDNTPDIESTEMGTIVMHTPELTLTIDPMDDRVTVEAGGKTEAMTVQAFCDDVLNRVRGTEKDYLDSCKAYAETIIKVIRDKVEELGGEWNLPTLWNQDEMDVGNAWGGLPKTIYLDTEGKPRLVLDVEGEEHEEPLTPATINVSDLKRLKEMLDRPIDD